MRPTINELSNSNRFRLLKTLHHKEIVDFVIENMRHFHPPIVFYYLFNLLLLLYVVFFGIYSIYSELLGWKAILLYFLAGIFLGMIAVIPFHEFLHGVAYKIAGAGKVKYGACLRQMLFYASAPGFVIGKRQFTIVALLPFVILNLVFITGYIFLKPEGQWASLVALISHSSLCIGDFAMMNFFSSKKEVRLFTYDDPEKDAAYFYEYVPRETADSKA